LELQNLRQGIITEWSIKYPQSYQTHAYNQFMYLIGQELKLPNAEMFSRVDPFAAHIGISLTKEEALEKFYKEYSPSKLIDQTKNKLLEFCKDRNKQDLVFSWLKDHAPDSWQRQLYQKALDRLEKMEEEKKSREEIFDMLINEFDIKLPRDESPLNAIKADQTASFMSQKNPEVASAEEWSVDFYNEVIEGLNAIDLSDRKEIENYLRDNKITFTPARDIRNLLKQHQQDSYLWNAAVIYDEDTYELKEISRDAATYAAIELKLVS
jgi:hypothetical protein